MKNAGCQILISLLGFFFSCTPHHKETLIPELIHTETLMYAHPDSALYLLESMPMPSPSDELQNATWSLLLVQARDKKYIKHTSDSLINVAFDYFIKQDDPKRKALVLNYKGRVNQDLGEIEKATEYYLQARDEIKKTDDCQLGYLINANLGMIYAYRSLNDLAMQSMQDAYAYASRGKDSVYLASSLIHMGRAYGITRQWQKAIQVYKEAAWVAEQIKDDKSLSWALNEISSIYLYIEKYDSALICLKKVEGLNSTAINLPQIYLSMGDTYRLIEKYDSAMVYLPKALVTDNIRTKQNIYHCLYLISKAQNNYEQLIRNSENYWACRDSIDRINKIAAVIEVQAKYDHEKLKRKNMELDLARNRILKSALLVLILLVVMIGTLINVYQRRLLKKERIIQRDKELIGQYMTQLHENNETINKNEERICELQEELDTHATTLTNSMDELTFEIETLRKQNVVLQNNNLDLHNKVSTSVQLLSEKNKMLDTYHTLLEKNAWLKKREKYLCMQLCKNIDVLKRLRELPASIKTTQEWEKIIDSVNSVYTNFTERLHKQCPSLTENDIQVCCLIKLHLSNTVLSDLLGVSASTITKRKQRMRERISQDLGSDFNKIQSLEIWLEDY